MIQTMRSTVFQEDFRLRNHVPIVSELLDNRLGGSGGNMMFVEQHDERQTCLGFSIVRDETQ